ncbi:MAG TPA: hypothetical protein VGW77_28575 [Candidatus Binatia bacterium]|jgi:hypothetical protein|nr:hypothetical protein [Candidatus Binatia bacterium]
MLGKVTYLWAFLAFTLATSPARAVPILDQDNSTLTNGSIGRLINTSLVHGLPLEDPGNTIFGPNTGFEWLDLTLTYGTSPNAVLGGFGGYVRVDGYHIATQTEVFDPFLNDGITTVTLQNNRRR